MQINDIFPEWASHVHTNYKELMAQTDEFWAQLVTTRNLIVLRGLPTTLTDEEFYALGEKFGRVWTREDYRKPFVTHGKDPTLPDPDSATPVSYFQSHNNAFGADYMAYHADMPHVNELSYPGRALYMVQNTVDGSGTTSWLNLETGWAACTPEEQGRYEGVEMVFHDMYRPETRMERLPFLKINPKNNRASPRVNCWYTGNPKTLAWIHHCERHGENLGYVDSGRLIVEVYNLIASKPRTIYQHHWQDGDIVVYDNWFNVHKRDSVNDGSGRSQRRLLKRLSFNFR